MNEITEKSISLTLTATCNLSCSYCYESNKGSKKMDISTAKRIIDYELENMGSYKSIEFDFFGGEPFLEFDLIRELTTYICERKMDVPCTVFATTNGTLVHGKIQTWLKEHPCFVCGLSLDGTREMHNLNRSNSYDAVDLNFFAQQYPDQDVKMTISKETLPMLAEGVIDLHKRGFLVSCNLAYGIDWSDQQNSIFLYRELNKLIDYYLENPDIEPCSMLGMPISNIGFHFDEAVRYCGAGIHMRSYDVDGQCYPCQFFMPLSIGEKKAKQARDIKFPKDILPERLIEKKCRKCVIRSACPNCFGSNYASSGNIYHRDDNMCRLTKIIMKARSYFRAKQWELGQIHESPDEVEALLRAIIKIQEELEV